MRKRFAAVMGGLLTFAVFLPTLVFATSVKQMNIEELSANADKIFRGTVISVQQGTVEAGGAELPTVTYTLKVDEAFKGEFEIQKDDVRLAKITMISDPKADDPTADIQRMGLFRDVPRLAVGNDYLLFTSAESRIGLSATIGLNQGCFDIVGAMALNRVGNLGLFHGAATAGPDKGPMPYAELSERIRNIVATQ